MASAVPFTLIPHQDEDVDSSATRLESDTAIIANILEQMVSMTNHSLREPESEVEVIDGNMKKAVEDALKKYMLPKEDSIFLDVSEDSEARYIYYLSRSMGPTLVSSLDP